MCVFRFGTERLYAQKEDLLHEVLELEAEKGLLASGECTKYQVGVSCVVSAEVSGETDISGARNIIFTLLLLFQLHSITLLFHDVINLTRRVMFYQF